jgi:DNA adenine methylase
LRIEEELSGVHLRLARATIENLTWQDFLKRYDKQKTFFYLHPPYYKAPFYEHNLELPDYVEMAEILAGIKAKFILSINDHKEMRKAFKGFKIRPVTLKYSVAEKHSTIGKELLISNF